jgi:chromosome segregation ATPase
LLYALVWNAAVELLRSPEQLEEIEASAQNLTDQNEGNELAILRALEAQKLTQQSNLLRQLRDAPDALAGLIKAEMITLQAELSTVTARKAELEAQTASKAALHQSRRDAAEMIRLALDHVDLWTADQRRAMLEIIGLHVRINRPDYEISLLSF